MLSAKENDCFYMKISTLPMRTSCETAAQQYFAAIEQELQSYKTVDLDTIRIAIRPIYYLGFIEIDTLQFYIKEYISGCPLTKDFLIQNNSVVEKNISILNVLEKYYDLHYDNHSNSVLLKNENEPLFF